MIASRSCYVLLMSQDTDPAALGPHRAMRVGELTDDHRLRVECVQCGHSGIVLAAYLHRRIKPQERLAAIEKRLKCTRCGEKGWAQWKIERATDDRG